ncbi:hypothetical protein FB451DRAFT_1370976 [Mycena latifolia]|nr:hypothetical protein FB451DRAFT_1370976 [Mycena latifolia]
MCIRSNREITRFLPARGEGNIPRFTVEPQMICRLPQDVGVPLNQGCKTVWRAHVPVSWLQSIGESLDINAGEMQDSKESQKIGRLDWRSWPMQYGIMQGSHDDVRCEGSTCAACALVPLHSQDETNCLIWKSGIRIWTPSPTAATFATATPTASMPSNCRNGHCIDLDPICARSIQPITFTPATTSPPAPADFTLVSMGYPHCLPVSRRPAPLGDRTQPDDKTGVCLSGTRVPCLFGGDESRCFNKARRSFNNRKRIDLIVDNEYNGIYRPEQMTSTVLTVYIVDLGLVNPSGRNGNRPNELYKRE